MPVVCTRKDAVKLRHLPLRDIWSLRVEVSFGPALWSGRTFPQWLDMWWDVHMQPRVQFLGEPSARWTGFSPASDTLWKPA